MTHNITATTSATMGLSLSLTARFFLASTFAMISVAARASNTSFSVQPFPIDLAREIPRLKSLVNNTRLPATALYPNTGPSKGINLERLLNLRTDWLKKYDWEAQQAELNQLVSLNFVEPI
jgi:hypothetical protein